MSGDYYRVLVRRARAFLVEARRLLEEGEPDLAAFSAEQAVQLRLKALLFRLTGSVPRSHSLRLLLGRLREALRVADLEGLALLVEKETARLRAGLGELEEAYTVARYGAVEYSVEEAAELVAVAEELWRLLEEVERQAAEG
ncbi:MAG: HEPN domain-containing protein [Crenarchaeota archaeon]|nr:HEPN domain-containing protein [Thermoproteota archaeon]